MQKKAALKPFGSDPSGGGLAALVLESRASLLRFLAIRRVPPEEAEDLVQELYLKLAQRPTGPVQDARAYLYRTLDNMIVDRRRSGARRGAREESWAETAGGESGVDDRPSPERIVMARARLAAVQEALAALPERTLFVFRRFRIDDVGQKAIADELGISVSAVEKHIQRAYRALVEVRQRLDADSPEPRRLPGQEGE